MRRAYFTGRQGLYAACCIGRWPRRNADRATWTGSPDAKPLTTHYLQSAAGTERKTTSGSFPSGHSQEWPAGRQPNADTPLSDWMRRSWRLNEFNDEAKTRRCHWDHDEPGRHRYDQPPQRNAL